VPLALNSFELPAPPYPPSVDIQNPVLPPYVAAAAAAAAVVVVIVVVFVVVVVNVVVLIYIKNRQYYAFILNYKNRGDK
jgi:hypothetical protein